MIRDFKKRSKVQREIEISIFADIQTKIDIIKRRIFERRQKQIKALEFIKISEIEKHNYF